MRSKVLIDPAGRIVRRLRLGSAILLALALSACDSPTAKLAHQYDLLRQSGAPASRLCPLSTRLAQANLDADKGAEFLRWERQRKVDCRPAASPSSPAAASAPTPSASPEPPVLGTIKGAVSYPSDYIPDDMRICAEKTGTREKSCKTVGFVTRYSMQLPPGVYRVWAQTNTFPRRAYYTRAVACGLTEQCNDHHPVEVTVRAGETKTGIDPGDYYGP